MNISNGKGLKMKCTLCQGDYREKAVVFSFRREGRSVVVENVPALVCDRCGDELLTDSTVRVTEDLIEEEPEDTTPLYRFPEKTPASR